MTNLLVERGSAENRKQEDPGSQLVAVSRQLTTRARGWNNKAKRGGGGTNQPPLLARDRETQ